MKKKQKKRMELNKTISIILNMILVFMGMIGFIETIKLLGKFDIKYYTQQSNLIAIFVELLYLYFITIEERVPKWLKLLKYIAVLSLIITFTVVLLILVPMFDFNYKLYMFTGSMLYYHTLCPLLALISFVFFEDYSFEKKDIIVGMTYTLAYAIVALILNGIGKLVGPYPFLEIRNNPWYASIIWFIVIIGGAFGLSYMLYYLKEKYNNHLKKLYK